MKTGYKIGNQGAVTNMSTSGSLTLADSEWLLNVNLAQLYRLHWPKSYFLKTSLPYSFIAFGFSLSFPPDQTVFQVYLCFPSRVSLPFLFALFPPFISSSSLPASFPLQHFISYGSKSETQLLGTLTSLSDKQTNAYKTLSTRHAPVEGVTSWDGNVQYVKHIIFFRLFKTF